MTITRRGFIGASIGAAAVAGLSACGGDKTPAGGPTSTAGAPGGGDAFPAGTMTFFGYGQPQWLMEYYNAWLERNRSIAPEVTLAMVQTESEADARQKLIQALSAGDTKSAADVIQTGRVSMLDMAKNGVLVDMTDYLRSIEDKLVPGALSDSEYDGKLYGMPDSVRPQLVFYNNEIFEKYGIDPESLATMEGYLEAGRKLKTDSKGEVQLSQVDPSTFAWRYWGRRGLLPQAKAQIWGDDGAIVFGENEGTRKALEFFGTLHTEGHLHVTKMFQAPLYEAINAGKIATFYIGAFMDEFLRGNVADMSGKWRVRSAPVFDGIGLGGAPVIGMSCAVNKDGAPYAGLWQKLYNDFHFDAAAREAWTTDMVAQNAPYANPIATELLADPFWKEPAEFYGGQSFREAESAGLENPSPNLRVTKDDAEADALISPEIEKFVAGAQSIDDAIKNADAALKNRIGQTDAA
ncbi:MAG: extracellular solute-binding protein [Tessaracoccus sp.]|uniref:ABC transporter substrate-binding protein n=1 Tax=Tessaracoccus sp. TaxID=1971211 RepID=UPI001ECAF54A|nr:extracellular solute-binding protein [Tessaracoccus sp.]MBK7820286.1 extracellular solute-binding protein [Tessaracoccus sp.]